MSIDSVVNKINSFFSAIDNKLTKGDGWLINWKNITNWERAKSSNRKIIGEREGGENSNKEGF